jgi:hypothetical protein
LFIVSGYGMFGPMPGNVLLFYGPQVPKAGTPPNRLCKKSANFGRFAKIPVIGRWRVFF